MPPYFAEIEPNPSVGRGYRTLTLAIRDLELKGRAAEAAVYRRVLSETMARFEALGPVAAAEADKIIRALIDKTAVRGGRPSRGGGLKRAIVSRPLSTTLPAGAIGIADKAELNRGAVNPVDHGIYWRAQEYGLPALTPADYTAGGRRVATGYFQPGSARPDPGQFRNHDYFQRASGRGTPALMRLAEVPERRFLRDGVDQVVVWHARQEDNILGDAIKELVAVRSLGGRP